MKKIIILVILLLALTGCSKETLTCTSTNTDNQGNVSKIKYLFSYKKDILNTVDKTIETKVKNPDQTKFMYEMYGQTFNIFDDPGVEMSGSYNKDTIKIFIKMTVDKIETINDITSIAKMNYSQKQMSLFLEPDDYVCK